MRLTEGRTDGQRGLRNIEIILPCDCM